jgi:hypothetical protein
MYAARTAGREHQTGEHRDGNERHARAVERRLGARLAAVGAIQAGNSCGVENYYVRSKSTEFAAAGATTAKATAPEPTVT